MSDTPGFAVPPDLRSKYPNLESFWPYLEGLNSESHRGQVLITAGFLEEQLKKILLAFMLDVPEAMKLLEGGNAPLGTFSARIDGAFTLGLITKNEHGDLTLIRRIRNEFAHELSTSFDTPSIKSRCAQLHHRAKEYGTVTVNAPGQFSTAAVGLIMNLINRPHYVSLQRRQLQAWPY